MVKRRKALGRGLDALLPAGRRDGVRVVPLRDILPSRSQPRKRFDEERLQELAESIRSYGILQPLVVTPADESGKHRILAGERRWQAAQMAGLDELPVVERDAVDGGALEIALIENLQREDLDPLEESAAFYRLVHEYGLTQEEVAGRVGRSRPSVANSLRLMLLPSAVKDALVAGTISEGHARALLGLPHSLAMESALERVTRGGLNVRQTEQLVASYREQEPPRRPAREQSPELRSLEDRLRTSLGTKVSLIEGRKSSKLVIEYYSQDDLAFLVERLLDAEAHAKAGSDAVR